MNPFVTSASSTGLSGIRSTSQRKTQDRSSLGQGFLDQDLFDNPPPQDPPPGGGGSGGGGGWGGGGRGGPPPPPPPPPPPSGGGSTGGSGGSGSGGGGPSEMAQWLQDLYAQYTSGEGAGGSNYGGDGFFTSGEDLMNILFGEAGLMQGASDRHFERILGREDQLEGFLDSLQGLYESSQVQTMDPTQFASVQRAEQALADFEDRTAQDMSSYNMALTRQFESQYNDVMTGMRPDGSMMTPQEQQDQKFRLQQNIGVARQQAMTSIMSDYNKQAAAMGMQVAQMTNSAEQMNLQANIINATNQMRVMELELQGRQALAQLTLNNPETVVSVLGGLMQLNQMGAGFQLMFGSGNDGGYEGDHPWYGDHFDGRFSQTGDFNTYEEFQQWYQENYGG